MRLYLKYIIIWNSSREIQIVDWEWVLIATAIYIYFVERISLSKHLKINIFSSWKMLPGKKFQADERKNKQTTNKKQGGKRLQKTNTIWCLGCNLPESVFQLEQVLQSVLRCFSVHSPRGVPEHLVHILQKSERTPKNPSTNYTRESWSCFVLKSIWIPNIVIATL